MSRDTAESVDHGLSWVPWATRGVRSIKKLSNATTFTTTNGEAKQIITTSNSKKDMKVSGKSNYNVCGTGLKTGCTKGRICRQLFVEPRGRVPDDIKLTVWPMERVNNSKIEKTKRPVTWNKMVMHDKRVDLSETVRDDADKGVEKLNYEKQSSKLRPANELDQPRQSSSDCSVSLSSFTVSFSSAANYFLTKKSLGPFNDNVNGQMRKTVKYISETEDKTDILSPSYPDNSSQSRLNISRSISDSDGSSFSNHSLRINVSGINNKNVRYDEKELILNRTSRRSPNCLQDTTHKLTSVIARSCNGGRIDKTSKGTAETACIVKKSGDCEVLQESVRKDAFQYLNCSVPLQNETPKSVRGEDIKTAYSVHNCGEEDGLKTLDNEVNQEDVEMSRSVELGLDVLLFAITRFKNMVKHCSETLGMEWNESETEDVLERNVNERKTVKDNASQLAVGVEVSSSNAGRSRRTTSEKREVNDQHLLGHRTDVHLSPATNTCFPSHDGRKYSHKKADQAAFR